VVSAGDLLLGPARDAYAADLVARRHRPLARFVPATTGNDAGIIGAADLARN
jgi:glucokinase